VVLWASSSGNGGRDRDAAVGALLGLGGLDGLARLGGLASLGGAATLSLQQGRGRGGTNTRGPSA
jgi:hypothetical protein